MTTDEMHSVALFFCSLAVIMQGVSIVRLKIETEKLRKELKESYKDLKECTELLKKVDELVRKNALDFRLDGEYSRLLMKNDSKMCRVINDHADRIDALESMLK